MIRSAVQCAAQEGRLLCFDETSNYHLQLAVEEATSNAVTHFSGILGEEERIHLEFFVEEFEKIGFSFAGVMPHIHNGSDRITLQWLDVRLDMAAIRTYGDKTKEVFDYIKTELERVKSLQ
ncbi:hypothetical protein [Maridesulfovibrio zosterae]|uniref:hypothetical protein n=1 Tax=Maridesulfovibrio zosterae TaxID=82171 RepID=UPI000480F949|nr:hypothetical protein [Maridesulfovibrio zosterae]